MVLEEKMRNKIITLLLYFACCFAIGCGNNSSQQNEQNTATKTPEVTQQVKEEQEQEEQQEEEGKIITDSTEIIAMAGSIVSEMTLEEKIGQLFIVNLEQLDNSKGDYYEFRKFTDEMKEKAEQYHIGGIILFARNMESIEQTKKLIETAQESVSIPLFISVDEEGGDVARVGNNSNMYTTKFPSMEEVGALGDLEYAYNMGETIGREIKELGFNLDFAPVADVKTNEYNTEIGNRSFGNDAKLVSNMVSKVVKGIQSQGISATLKHFPGHGSTTGDSHTSPVNADTDLLGLRSNEFKPFRAGIEAGADFVMISHISISRVTESTVPASMSDLVVKNMLRDELEFKGVVITDAMDMGAITEKYEAGEATINCIKAGVDIVLMTTDIEEAYNAIYDAVESGEISETQITESVQRIMETKIKRGIVLSNTDLLK